MITAVDTNVVLDVLIPGQPCGESSKKLLDHHLANGKLIICEVVYAELASSFTSEKELKQFQDAARVADEATLSEQEKLRRRVAELETERDVHATAQREQAIRMAAVTAAARLGFADPEDAFALLDREAIEFDDAGTPKNVSRLLTDLLTAKPYLGAAHARPMGSADGGARAGAPTLQEQAADAESRRDWKTSISAKNRQLVEQAQKR